MCAMYTLSCFLHRNYRVYVFQQKNLVKNYSGVSMGVMNFVCLYYHSIYIEITRSPPPRHSRHIYQDRVHKLSGVPCMSYHVICT